MADTKISALPASTTPLAGTEVLPVVQSNATKKVSVDNLTAGKAVPMLSMTPGEPNAIGFAQTPANWLSGYKALDFAGGAIEGSSTLTLYGNAYRHTGGSFIYKNNGAASQWNLASGLAHLYTAASGTAGNSFSWTTSGIFGASGFTTGSTFDPFSRGYSKNLAVTGGSGAHAIAMNAPTGNGCYFDMGVNGTRSAGLYADASVVEFAAFGTNNFAFATAGQYRMVIETGGDTRPGANNVSNLGNATARWKEVFAVNGTINTSDARLKTAILPLTDAEIAAAQDLVAEIGTFQWLESVAAKGDKARHHAGMTVQRAIEIMQSHGLDPMSYAFICHDVWEEDFREVEDDTGDIIKELVAPKTEVRTVKAQEIKIIAGKAVLCNVDRTEVVPVVAEMPVFDEDGSPVMIDVPERKDEEGNVVAEAFSFQAVHHEPVMETITKRFRKIVLNPAGDCYAFRLDQLLAFMLRGLVAKLEKSV